MNWVHNYMVLVVVMSWGFTVHAQESVLHWKNGDVLPGRLLESGADKIHWSSPLFLDDVVVDMNALDSIAFPKQEIQSFGNFRVGTTSGDLFTAELIASDQEAFYFSNQRFGEFQVKRDAVYSLDQQIQTNLVFDGANLQNWNWDQYGPIKNLRYKSYEENWISGKPFPNLSNFVPAEEGGYTFGFFDLGQSSGYGSGKPFALRFEGQLDNLQGGNYRFDVSANDAARLFINGTLIIDENSKGAELKLPPGNHIIQLDFLSYGGDTNLKVWINGKSLVNNNRIPDWNAKSGGHPYTDKQKAILHRPVEIPNHFDIDVEFAASNIPRFVMALGNDIRGAESNNSLRIETWDNIVVVVQDKIFQTVMKIKEGQTDVRLRISYDESKKELRVFHTNGKMLETVRDVRAETGNSGIYIRNRGEDLSIRRLNISQRSTKQSNVIFNGSQLSDWGGASHGPIQNLTYKVYREAWGWNELAPFDPFPSLFNLEPEDEGYLGSGYFDIGLSKLRRRFAMRFEGQIDIQQDGDYIFDLIADDKAQLFIDDNLVVDFLENGMNPNAGGNSKTIQLRKGKHTIRLDFLDLGGANRLSAGSTGPNGIRTNLVGVNSAPLWFSGTGGHPQTNRLKTGIFHALRIPEQFELNVEIASSESPRFVLALSKNKWKAESNPSLRLETREDELVVVQGSVIEPVFTIEQNQTDVRLRILYDHTKNELSVFDANGSMLVTLNDVKAEVGRSGVYLRNRGEDLTIQRLVISESSDTASNHIVDADKPRIYLSGQIVEYGILNIANRRAYVVTGNGSKREIEMDSIERIANPKATLAPDLHDIELTYTDGAIIRGRIETIDSNQIFLKTGFSAPSVHCLLSGVSSLHFGPKETNNDIRNNQSDLLYMSSGFLRGKLAFDLEGSPLSWKPDGVDEPLRLVSSEGARIERSESTVADKYTYNKEDYPSLLHLKDGEIIPCKIISYDEERLQFESPFIETRELESHHIKAIEFHPPNEWGIQEEINETDGKFIGIYQDEKSEVLGIDSVILERSLTIPRFKRENPPSHILVANNGDIKRGKLISINPKTIRFESKLRKVNIPVDRLMCVVNVSKPDDSELGQSNNSYDSKDKICAKFVDGSVFLFEADKSKHGMLMGRSPIYGNLSIPFDGILSVNLSGFENDTSNHVFGEWFVRPAKEPEYSFPVLTPIPETN